MWWHILPIALVGGALAFLAYDQHQRAHADVEEFGLNNNEEPDMNNMPIAQPANSNTQQQNSTPTGGRLLDDEAKYQASDEMTESVEDLYKSAAPYRRSNAANNHHATICNLCEDREIDAVFQPCFHSRTCMQCSMTLKANNDEFNMSRNIFRKSQPLLCPFCQAPVRSIHKVYR